jgi:acyl-coenzyme A thioesterase PaaI-like protein
VDAETLRSAGWSSLEGTGFTSTLGLIWRRGQGPDLTVGFLSDARHCNNDARIVHGGALMTFADIGLGFGVARAHGATNLVTAHLQMNFVAAAPVGAFIHVRPEIVRKGAQLIFVRGLVLADDKTVASADGMWKVLEPRS